MNMNMKITTLALAGVIALGSTATAYAATNNTVHASSLNTSKGAVVEQSKKSNDQLKEADEQDLTAANTKTAITEEQAKHIAMDSIKGGTFVAIELEDENRVIVYGVEVQSGKDVYDVKVDANTGTIIKSDRDNDKNEKNGIKKENKNNDSDNVEHENQNEDPAGYEN